MNLLIYQMQGKDHAKKIEWCFLEAWPLIVMNPALTQTWLQAHKLNGYHCTLL